MMGIDIISFHCYLLSLNLLTPKNGRSGLTRLDRPVPRLDRLAKVLKRYF
jgi:hypothetical protein